MEPWFICTRALNISAHYELIVFVMALINSQSSPEEEEYREQVEEFTALDSEGQEDDDVDLVELGLLTKR